MNDFTKEELQILLRALNHWVGEYAGDEIKEKIQCMIDNYCEHECSSPLLGLIKECIKCRNCIDHRRMELSQQWMKE